MMKVKLISHTPEPEKIVTSAAKLCYSPVGINEIQKGLDEEKINNFINMLMGMGHESPIEHVSFTFAIEGVSRSLTHQLVRHRIASYSQQSQRYVRENQFEYIAPPEIKNNKRARKIFIEHMEASQKAYDDIIIELMFEKMKENNKYDKWCKEVAEYTEIDDGDGAWCIDISYKDMCSGEDSSVLLGYFDMFKESFPNEYRKIEKRAIENARYVLPNATETKIILTMNARSLLNFFNLRCCNRAQDEIRELADRMLIECKKVAPTLFKYAGASCMFDNCPEGKMSCGNPRNPNEYEI